MGMKRFIFWSPFAVFVLFLMVFISGLITPEGQTIRSQMIGKPIPPFSLAPGVPNLPGLGSRDLADGKPKLLNIFASWCVPCAAEAGQLADLSKAGVPVVAIAIRDKPADIRLFLARYGNPYARIGSDPESKMQIALGSSGVPETFVIDGKGIVRYQHIGQIAPGDVSTLLGEVGKAR